MDETYLDQLRKVRQDYGQRIASYPQDVENLRSQIYGGDETLPTLRATRDDAISQLWDVDKRLAERYANPQSETFIRDPYRREQLAAGQHQSVLNSVSGAERLVQQRENMLGNLLDKSLDILKLNLQGKATEHNMLLDELNASLKSGSGSSLSGLQSLAALGLLGGQDSTTTNELGLSPAEMFKARVLSGAAGTPQPELEGGGTKGRVDQIIGSMLGGLTGRSPGAVQGVNYPDVEVLPEALQQVMSQRPQVEQGVEGTDTVSALQNAGIDLNALQTIAQSDPKLADEIAEKYITQQFFPKDEEWTPQKRQAIADATNDIYLFNNPDEANEQQAEKAPATVEELYQDLIRMYPELTPEEILKLLQDFYVIR